MIKVTHIKTPQEMDLAYEIRRIVFIQEQNVPEAEEYDDLDNQAIQFLLWKNQEAIGTARFRTVDGWGKLERIAILKAHRGEGNGKTLVQAILKYADITGIQHLKLSSQTYAVPFYEKLGFIARGEIYLDANIEHRDMFKE